MHEVSLRAASNRMDAHNLALVLCPNLVSGPDPIKDVAICAVPGGPTLYDPTSAGSHSKATQLPVGKTTLGAVIKLCIQRYYEVFDEILDRNEAIPQPWTLRGEPSSPGGSSVSSGSKQFSGFLRDDDDEVDDGMPSHSSGQAQHEGRTSPTQQVALNAPYQPRHRSNLSGARSAHTAGEDQFGTGNGNLQATAKAKSMISIENGHNVPGVRTRRGSISIGRGTGRSSGAGVEAISITAGGFFTPPNSVPPVPLTNGGLKAGTKSPRNS